MRFFLFSLLCAVLFSSAQADASLPPTQCKIVRMWKANISGEDICKEMGGIFCEKIDNVGEGMCRATNGGFCSSVDNEAEGLCSALGGKMCMSVANTAEAICLGLNGTFCSKLSSKDEKLWRFKLDEACGFN